MCTQVDFPPDLCSRVTFVNFTVTRSSLQSQCLNRVRVCVFGCVFVCVCLYMCTFAFMCAYGGIRTCIHTCAHQVLKAERPDVDSKRSDLLKLQGEFLLRLRHLEKSLLVSLNETKGRILDDDSIITNLERLKKEAQEIAKRVEETDATIMEVESTSQQYAALAQACSSIYFTLEALHQASSSLTYRHCYTTTATPPLPHFHCHTTTARSLPPYHQLHRCTFCTSTHCSSCWRSSPRSSPPSRCRESATTLLVSTSSSKNSSK